MSILDVCKKRIKSYLGIPSYSTEPVVYPSSSKEIGSVLYSYLDYSLGWESNDKRFDGHSNLWESREIVNILRGMGFKVEAVPWTDRFFYPQKSYDVIFDIHTNLQRWAPFLKKETKKILHLTGSYFNFQRDAELARVSAFEDRSGCLYSPKRIPADLDLAERSHRLADYCSLIGNEITLQTYPEIYRSKITPVPVSGSRLDRVKSASDEYVPAEREFLWFYGGGAVHKGLDLVLEVFKRNPDLTLHVVAKLESEKDFLLAYGDTLLCSSNVHYHGYLHPASAKFHTLAQRIVANIAPSCSEGISPATVTCMQYGFYPIISRHNGITLPAGQGIYLEVCSILEIEEKVRTVFHMPKARLQEEIKACQSYALEEFSRENFSNKMRTFLSKTLGI